MISFLGPGKLYKMGKYSSMLVDLVLERDKEDILCNSLHEQTASVPKSHKKGRKNEIGDQCATSNKAKIVN